MESVHNSGLLASVQSIMTKITQAQKMLQQNEVAILAGHYCIAPELADLSNDEATQAFSFTLGVLLYKALRLANMPARLILWINDIGISQQQREYLKSQFELPANYAAILQQESLLPNEVEVIFESASRNKASTLLRKKIKQTPERFQQYTSDNPALIRCIDMDSCRIDVGKTVYAITGPEGAPLVMKEGSNPKCNLILATLFFRIAQHHPELLFVNIFNDIYIERIRLGMFVAKEVYQLPNTFINLFCDDDSYFEENFYLCAEEEKHVV